MAEPDWESLTGVVPSSSTTKQSKCLKALYQYQATTVDVDDKQGINSQVFAGCVNASERFLVCKNIVLNERRALEFVAYHIPNSELGLNNVFERGQQEKDDTSFNFRPDL